MCVCVRVRAPHSGAVRGDGCCFGFVISVRTEYTLLLVTQQMYGVAGRRMCVCVHTPHSGAVRGDGCCFGFVISVWTEYTLLLVT